MSGLSRVIDPGLLQMVRNFRKPLVVASPKVLLRLPVSGLVLWHAYPSVRRCILSTGI